MPARSPAGHVRSRSQAVNGVRTGRPGREQAQHGHDRQVRAPLPHRTLMPCPTDSLECGTEHADTFDATISYLSGDPLSRVSATLFVSRSEGRLRSASHPVKAAEATVR
jgi:hypothetical protein